MPQPEDAQVIIELTPHTLHALRAVKGKIEAGGEAVLENRPSLEALLDKIVPEWKADGIKAVVSVWPDATSWHLSNDTEAMLDRTPDALRAIAGRNLGDPRAAVAYAACNSGDGAPVTPEGTEAWVLASSSSDSLEKISTTLVELKVDTDALGATAFDRAGAISSYLRLAGKGTVALWDLSTTQSSVLLVTAKGIVAAVSCDVGMESIFEAVQSALKLKFRGAGARLFFNESYDFSEIGSKVGAAVGAKLKVAVDQLPKGEDTPALACLGLTGNQAWFTKELAAAIGMPPWEPESAKMAADMGLTFADPALESSFSPASAGLFGTLSSQLKVTEAWHPAWVVAEALPEEVVPEPPAAAQSAPPMEQPTRPPMPSGRTRPPVEVAPAAPAPTTPSAAARTRPPATPRPAGAAPPFPTGAAPPFPGGATPPFPSGATPPLSAPPPPGGTTSAPLPMPAPPLKASRAPAPAAAAEPPAPGATRPPMPIAAAAPPLPAPPMPGTASPFPPSETRPPSFSRPAFEPPEPGATTPPLPGAPGVGMKFGAKGAGRPPPGVTALPFEAAKLKPAVAADAPEEAAPRNMVAIYIWIGVAAAIIFAVVAVILEGKMERDKANDLAQQEELAHHIAELRLKEAEQSAEQDAELSKKELDTAIEITRKQTEDETRREVLAEVELERLAKMPGKILLATQPAGAAVSIDGGAPLTSPISADGITPGTHHLHISLAYYLPADLTVQVKGSKTSDLGTVALQTTLGSLDVSSVPSHLAFAVRTADNPMGLPVRSGRTPASLDGVLFGDYVVTFTRPECHDHVVKVTVRRGARSPVATRYEDGSLELTSDPSGAWVDKDGTRLGTTPITIRNLTPKRADFVLTLPGYDPTPVTCEIPEGETLKLDTMLLRKDRVLMPSEVKTMPVGFETPQPVLTDAQRKAGAEVLVAFTVQLDGSVSDVVIEKASDEDVGRLCQAAVEHWRFSPGRAPDDRIVDVRMEMPLKFPPQE